MAGQHPDAESRIQESGHEATSHVSRGTGDKAQPTHAAIISREGQIRTTSVQVLALTGSSPVQRATKAKMSADSSTDRARDRAP